MNALKSTNYNLWNNSLYDPYESDRLILTQLREYNDTVNDLIIQERNGEIKQLETDLKLIAEIQQDLASLVTSQGEVIDITAKNVENTEVAVTESTKHIKQATSTQKSTNKLFIGGLLTAASVTVGGGLLTIASPLAGALIAGGGVVSGVVMVLVKLVK